MNTYETTRRGCLSEGSVRIMSGPEVALRQLLGKPIMDYLRRDNHRPFTYGEYTT